MVDVHCHVLPLVDDGAKSWDIAVNMCRIAFQDGITHIVATPHANETYSFNREILTAHLQNLSERVGHALSFSLGCDFHLSYDNLADAMGFPTRYTINRGPYLLVEFSDFGIPPQVSSHLFGLRNIGIIPVITHPERNPILQHNPGQVLVWVRQGCAVQATASAFTGFWGEQARRCALWLLEREAVHVLATDAHDDRRRVPILSEARSLISKCFGLDVARALVEDNPGAIVAGQPLPFFYAAAS